MQITDGSTPTSPSRQPLCQARGPLALRTFFPPVESNTARGEIDARPPDGSGLRFVALREQLGLALERDCGPVRSIVIEHVERPSPN
jgi:uncharacterized protein (TIGR03435 family)